MKGIGKNPLSLESYDSSSTIPPSLKCPVKACRGHLIYHHSHWNRRGEGIEIRCYECTSKIHDHKVSIHLEYNIARPNDPIPLLVVQEALFHYNSAKPSEVSPGRSRQVFVSPESAWPIECIAVVRDNNKRLAALNHSNAARDAKKKKSYKLTKDQHHLLKLHVRSRRDRRKALALKKQLEHQEAINDLKNSQPWKQNRPKGKKLLS